MTLKYRSTQTIVGVSNVLHINRRCNKLKLKKQSASKPRLLKQNGKHGPHKTKLNMSNTAMTSSNPLRTAAERLFAVLRTPAHSIEEHIKTIEVVLLRVQQVQRERDAEIAMRKLYRIVMTDTETGKQTEVPMLSFEKSLREEIATAIRRDGDPKLDKIQREDGVVGAYVDRVR